VSAPSPTPYVVPSDDPSIFEMLQTLQGQGDAGALAIVRPSSPPPGIGGYLFDFSDEERVRCQSLITNHFVEDNTTVQDQVGLLPEKVTLRGMVAELTNGTQPNTSQAPPGPVLPINPATAPGLTASQTQAQAAGSAASLSDAASSAGVSSLYGYFLGQTAAAPPGTRQAQAFAYFYQAWKGRMLMSVETPVGIWESMVIEQLDWVQPQDTKYASTFTVAFTKFRVVGDITVNTGAVAGRAGDASTPPGQNGTLGQTTPTFDDETQDYSQFDAPPR
jgi:hypothetical protein